jgi:hypothetical protein
LTILLLPPALVEVVRSWQLLIARFFVVARGKKLPSSASTLIPSAVINARLLLLLLRPMYNKI